MGGKWFGRLPLAGANQCQIRFYPGGTFDFFCRGPEGWAGQGHYHVRGDALDMEYLWISQRGTKSNTVPNPLKLQLKGELNHVDATLPSGDRLSWDRKL